jgi:hypothetical protein
MKKSALLILFLFFTQIVPAFARGVKCIPHIPDGSGYKTKIDVVNVSSRRNITNFRIRFFQPNGSPWSLSTSLGTGSSFTLSIPMRSVTRIETSGLSSPATGGYALVEDLEPYNSVYSSDFAVGLTVYYEISNVSGVQDAVAIPVIEGTCTGTLPVEISAAKGINTAIALVNLSSVANDIWIDLIPTGTGESKSVHLVLDANSYQPRYLNQMFDPLGDFKGIIEFESIYPIALLSLLETQGVNGPQYSTLVPVDREDLRRNTNLYVPMPKYGGKLPAMPIDIDKFIVDYFRVGEEDSFAWDLLYVLTNSKTRKLSPLWGQIAVLGKQDEYNFDAVTLNQLKNLTYGSDPIDLSDGSTAMSNIPYSFAVLTDVGNYAKVRIIGVKTFTDSGNPYYDLILEVTVYR